MSATQTSYNPAYRYGEARPRKIPFVTSAGEGAPANTSGPGVVINAGDLCFVSGPARVVGDGATNSNTTVTSATALFTPGDIGAAISGGTIPASTTITAVGSSTSVTISQAAGSTATSVSLTITPAQPVSLYPAISFPWTTNLATTQGNFVKSFAGVAAQAFDGTNASAYGVQDGLIRVDTGGVFDFPCASGTFNVGDLVAPAQDPGSGNYLANQVVALVNASGAANAIGRVVQPYTTATTIVRCELIGSALNLFNTGQI